VIDYPADPVYSNIQGFFFNADGKTVGGYWKIDQTVDGVLQNRLNTVNYMEYNSKGYLTLHSYRCDRPGIDAWEVMYHEYDDKNRMVLRRFDRPAGAFRPPHYDDPLLVNWYYRYDNRQFPQLPSHIVTEYIKPSYKIMAHDLEYGTDASNRITQVRRLYSDGRREEDRYEYNVQGKIAKAFRPPRLQNVPVNWEYAYDDLGRNLSVHREGELEWKFTYRPDGRLDVLYAPTPHYHPSISKYRNMTFQAVYHGEGIFQTL
jgi:hypothetical protein